MKIAVFDGHCDVFTEIMGRKEGSLFFDSTDKLHSSLERLRQGGVKVQTMAVFVPTEVPKSKSIMLPFK